MDPTTLSKGKSDELASTGWKGNARWNPLLRAGAWSAMIFVLLVFIPLFLVFATPIVPTGYGRAILE